MCVDSVRKSHLLEQHLSRVWFYHFLPKGTWLKERLVRAQRVSTQQRACPIHVTPPQQRHMVRVMVSPECKPSSYCHRAPLIAPHSFLFSWTISMLISKTLQPSIHLKLDKWKRRKTNTRVLDGFFFMPRGYGSQHQWCYLHGNQINRKSCTYLRGNSFVRRSGSWRNLWTWQTQWPE